MDKTAKKKDLLPAFFLLAIGIFVIAYSYKLDLGFFRRPGPGLMPFLLGIILILLTVPIIMRSISTKAKNIAGDTGPKVTPSKVKIGNVVLTLVLLFAYIFLLEKLGYLITTTLLLIFLFKRISSLNWKFSLGSAILTATATWEVFTLLGVRFPKGIFGV